MQVTHVSEVGDQICKGCDHERERTEQNVRDDRSRQNIVEESENGIG